jgi:hypothetical protein
LFLAARFLLALFLSASFEWPGGAMYLSMLVGMVVEFFRLRVSALVTEVSCKRTPFENRGRLSVEHTTCKRTLESFKILLLPQNMSRSLELGKT